MSFLTLTIMNVFIYGNAQIDERFLNRDKWGNRRINFTLLIGIKAELLQFILYPDNLLKLSNSLIILETETSSGLNIE